MLGRMHSLARRRTSCTTWNEDGQYRCSFQSMLVSRLALSSWKSFTAMLGATRTRCSNPVKLGKEGHVNTS